MSVLNFKELKQIYKEGVEQDQPKRVNWETGKFFDSQNKNR